MKLKGGRGAWQSINTKKSVEDKNQDTLLKKKKNRKERITTMKENEKARRKIDKT